MTVQTEEQQAVSPEMALNTADSESEQNLDSREGWRIAREALLREVVRYGGQGALVLLLLGTIGYAGYWSVSEMKSLPLCLKKIAQPFFPPPLAVSPMARWYGSPSTKLEEERASAKAPVKKHHVRQKNTQIASKVGRRPYGYAAAQGDPTGGHIIYQDGMITQYSWNK